MVRNYLEPNLCLNIKELYGLSLSIFIGRLKYLNVYVGSMAPPSTRDVSIYDYPEKQINRKIGDIIDFRLSLVRVK